MKLLLAILLIAPLFCIGQNKGKIVRNQSVKVVVVWKDTVCIATLTNSNSCKSIIEFKLNTLPVLQTLELRQFESQDVLIIPPFHLKVRNSTTCPKGTTEWLTLDSGRLIDEVSTTNISIGKIRKQVNCETIKLPINPPVLDTTIATKLQ